MNSLSLSAGDGPCVGEEPRKQQLTAVDEETSTTMTQEDGGKDQPVLQKEPPNADVIAPEDDDGTINKNHPSSPDTTDVSDVGVVLKKNLGESSDDAQHTQAPAPMEDTSDRIIENATNDNGDVETGAEAAAVATTDDETNKTVAASDGAAKKDDNERLDTFDFRMNTRDFSEPVKGAGNNNSQRDSVSFDFKNLVAVENQKKDDEIWTLKQTLGDREDSGDLLSHESLHSISGDSKSSNGAIFSPEGASKVAFAVSERTRRGSRLVRVSSAVDLETGKRGGGRRSKVKALKAVDEPQSQSTRRRRGMKKFGKRLVNPFWGHEIYDGDDDDSEGSLTSKISMHGRLRVNTTVRNQQYRLTALGPKDRFKGLIDNAVQLGQKITIYEDTSSYDRKGCCDQFGFHPNQWVIRYLHWAFRRGFLAVLLSGMLAFFVLTIIFAALILALGSLNPHCIHVNGVDFGTTGANFMDAYALSWTTFSTVGYGLVFPATSSTTDFVKKCQGVFFLVTLESFVGILFASLAGAIVFAKIARAASHAQVQFSDPIVIKYGSGVYNADDDDDDDDDNDEDSSDHDEEAGHHRTYTAGSQRFTPSKLPCPVIEFRVLNRLHAHQGGEIIDGTMNIVASIDEKNASQSLRGNVRGARRKGKKRPGKRKHRATASDFSFVQPSSKGIKKMKARVDRIITTSRNQTFQEDPSGALIPKRIFAKLDTESQEHPFFKRLWMVRHVLDHNSPILSQDAKELIRMNGGHWPEELNNAEGVRGSLDFDQILVSLSGTSNVDANSVYAQKIYDYIDLVVGYRFCNILFREKDGTVGVDPSLLNDVLEQNGGGGEDLNARIEASKKREVVIL